MVSNSMWPMTTRLDKVTLETDCILLNIGLSSYMLCDFCEMKNYLKIFCLICTAGLII